jgi:hypothetical protein
MFIVSYPFFQLEDSWSEKMVFYQIVCGEVLFRSKEVKQNAVQGMTTFARIVFK